MSRKEAVLLVGSNMMGTSLVQRLRHWGYDCMFAGTVTEALQHLQKKRGGPSLVLSQLRLDDGLGSTLIGAVQEKKSTLLLCTPVRDGCLWIPAVRRGLNCWGDPVFRPNQLKEFLASTASHQFQTIGAKAAIPFPATPASRKNRRAVTTRNVPEPSMHIPEKVG